MEGNEELHIKRSDFPDGFLFGAATSSYQVEGAYLEDAKSLSNWDAFCHSEDIDMMHSLGIKAYRFSISWARILPRGRSGEVNPAGITFYNKIIDNLILKGIEPFVTMHHFDFPQELEVKYGSWLNPEMQEEFVLLAETCYKYFGDRVKYWITINEPNLFTNAAYESGDFPPARCSEPFGNCLAGNSDVEPLIVMHNMLLANGKATKLYHDTTHGGSIGIVVSCLMYEPLTNTDLDREAAERAFAFNIGWVLDHLIYGDYPEEMHKYLGSRLPSFSLEEKNLLKNSIDFIGINHYSTMYTKDCINSSCSSTGAHAIQGYSSPDVCKERVDEILNDVKRIEFHSKYLAFLAKSLSYEWLQGYDVRFGLYYVDRKTLTRRSKLSAKWYKDFLMNNIDLIDMKALGGRRSFQNNVMMLRNG
uniref:Uncharacterized protein n=1 Tax=Lactuca sativa TaxID=4236 RepID=A0A9R1UJN6_LACSA|nr:hypothetical protein LSAT_V11C900493870 [Lactuca sativa]